MIPASVRIFVCTAPQDLRRSFDGLALRAREVAGEDPTNGAIFVFLNKRANRLKVLWWDRNGYCLLYKRLHRAIFRAPEQPSGSGGAFQIEGAQLAKLIAGISLPSRAKEIRNPG
jgi:transposase